MSRTTEGYEVSRVIDNPYSNLWVWRVYDEYGGTFADGEAETQRGAEAHAKAEFERFMSMR